MIEYGKGSNFILGERMEDHVSDIDNRIFGYIGNVYAHGCMYIEHSWQEE